RHPTNPYLEDQRNRSTALSKNKHWPLSINHAAETALPTLLDYPRLLPQRDQLSWSSPHPFIECAASCRVVAHEGDDFFYYGGLGRPRARPERVDRRRDRPLSALGKHTHDYFQIVVGALG